MSVSTATKIALKHSTRISLHERFSQLPKSASPRVNLSVSGLTAASSKNRNLAQALERKHRNENIPMVQQKKGVKSRLGSQGVKARLGGVSPLKRKPFLAQRLGVAGTGFQSYSPASRGRRGFRGRGIAGRGFSQFPSRGSFRGTSFRGGRGFSRGRGLGRGATRGRGKPVSQEALDKQLDDYMSKTDDSMEFN